MPQLREYTSQTSARTSVGIAERGPESFGLASARADELTGQRVASLGQTIMKRAEQAEVSDLTAKMATAQAELASRWRERLNTADPGDRELTQKFMDEVETYLDQTGSNVGTAAGQEYFNATKAKLQAHFLQTAAAGQAELAAIKAQEDLATTINSASSALVDDPSGFNHSLDLFYTSLDAQVATGAFDPTTAARLKKEGTDAIAKSAIQGWINLSPEIAEKQLKNGQWDQYLQGAEKNSFLNQVDMAKKAEEAERERQRRLAEERRRLEQEATQNEFLARMHKGELSAKDILNSNLNPFGSGSKNQFLDMLKTSSTKELRANPAVVQDLFRRIVITPEGHPEKITDAGEIYGHFVEGNLDRTTTDWLIAHLNGTKTPEGKKLHRYKQQFYKSMEQRIKTASDIPGFENPRAEEDFLAFIQVFDEEFDRQVKAGKSPHELLNPNSKDYLGHLVTPFLKTSEEIMNDMLTIDGVPEGVPHPRPTPEGTPEPTPTPTPEPRREGETAAEYLKRLGLGNTGGGQ